MQSRHWTWATAASIVVGWALLGCAPADPPTITAPPPGQAPAIPVNPGAGGGVEITLAPPGVPPAPSTIEPVTIGALVAYQDAGGKFGMDVPDGWAEARQTEKLSGDAKLGTVFGSPNGSGLVSVTQFDNGQVPEALGMTANQVMKLTGVTNQPNYMEIGRHNVLQRPGEAMTVEMTYTGSTGIPMRSLMLFQIDGTTFSMVNAAVEAQSWNENEGMIRDILASYKGPTGAGVRQVPGAPQTPGAPAGATP